MYHEIKYLFPTATDDDFSLRDDGDGAYIEYWNIGKLGAEPTQQELDAAAIPCQAVHQKAAAEKEYERRVDALTSPDIRKKLLAIMDAVVRVRRVQAGRPNSEDNDELVQLESLAGVVQTLVAKRDALNAAIDASPDPASIDVTDEAHWT